MLKFIQKGRKGQRMTNLTIFEWNYAPSFYHEIYQHLSHKW